MDTINNCSDELIIELKYDREKYDGAAIPQVCGEAVREIRKLQWNNSKFPVCKKTGEQLEIALRYINCKYGLIYYCKKCHDYMMPGSLHFWDDIDAILNRVKLNPNKYINSRNITGRHQNAKAKGQTLCVPKFYNVLQQRTNIRINKLKRGERFYRTETKEPS